MEIWKKINGLNNYLISNNGRIKGIGITTRFGKRERAYPDRYLKPWKSKTGYNYIDISDGGKRHRFLVHRLTAIYFIENIYNLPQVNHIDGNKNNNHISNLEWCSAKYNLKHARDLGLNKSIGYNNKMAKLTKDQIIEIRNSNMELKDLSLVFGVSQSVLSRIINFKSYRNV